MNIKTLFVALILTSLTMSKIEKPQSETKNHPILVVNKGNIDECIKLLEQLVSDIVQTAKSFPNKTWDELYQEVKQIGEEAYESFECFTQTDRKSVLSHALNLILSVNRENPVQDILDNAGEDLGDDPKEEQNQQIITNVVWNWNAFNSLTQNIQNINTGDINK